MLCFIKHLAGPYFTAKKIFAKDVYSQVRDTL